MDNLSHKLLFECVGIKDKSSAWIMSTNGDPCNQCSYALAQKLVQYISLLDPKLQKLTTEFDRTFQETKIAVRRRQRRRANEADERRAALDGDDADDAVSSSEW